MQVINDPKYLRRGCGNDSREAQKILPMQLWRDRWVPVHKTWDPNLGIDSADSWHSSPSPVTTLEPPHAPRADKSRPNIRTVAKHASVAISTVSRVLNGGRVSDEVRQRVLAAINELGYSPSITAQSLVTRRANCVGLAVNTTQSSWFSQILAGVEEALLPTRLSVLLGSLMLSGHYDPGAVLAWIQERRVDGLILVRYSTRDQHLLDAAVAARLPVVLLAPDVRTMADHAVRCDNASAGRLVAEHLLALGHKRIAFAGGPADSLDSRERLEGLRDVLRAHGIAAPTEVWVAPSYTTDSGERFAAGFAEQPAQSRATAVVAGNDAIAIGFMQGVLQRGLSVPKDVSVVGFDGIPDGTHIWPRLTTVALPTRSMAAAACRALLGNIQSADRPLDLPATPFGVELVTRESTGAAAS